MRRYLSLLDAAVELEYRDYSGPRLQDMHKVLMFDHALTADEVNRKYRSVELPCIHRMFSCNGTTVTKMFSVMVITVFFLNAFAAVAICSKVFCSQVSFDSFFFSFTPAVKKTILEETVNNNIIDV